LQFASFLENKIPVEPEAPNKKHSLFQINKLQAIIVATWSSCNN